jgi:hypothetical protein
MNKKIQARENSTGKLPVAHPGPPSIEDLLRYIDPAPDKETERFVATIYADRRDSARLSPPE